MPRVQIDMSPSTLHAVNEPDPAIGGLANLAAAWSRGPQERAQIEQQRANIAWNQQHQQEQLDRQNANDTFEHSRQTTNDGEMKTQHAWERQHGDTLAEQQNQQREDTLKETGRYHDLLNKQHGEMLTETSRHHDQEEDWRNNAIDEKKVYHAGQLQALHDKIKAGKGDSADLSTLHFHARQLAIHQAESESKRDEHGHRSAINPARVDELTNSYEEHFGAAKDDANMRVNGDSLSDSHGDPSTFKPWTPATAPVNAPAPNATVPPSGESNGAAKPATPPSRSGVNSAPTSFPVSASGPGAPFIGQRYDIPTSWNTSSAQTTPVTSPAAPVDGGPQPADDYIANMHEIGKKDPAHFKASMLDLKAKDPRAYAATAKRLRELDGAASAR